MNDAVAKLERRAEELRGQIRQEVKTSLESSIESAFGILTKKFQDADKYADQAAKRYEKAVRWAAWKVFAVAVMIGLSLIFAEVLLLQQTVPTYSEIISLRAEKQGLEATISDLAKRGGRIQLNVCGDQYKRLCAKIDEQAPVYKLRIDTLNRKALANQS
jgi:hypothetical protein